MTINYLSDLLEQSQSDFVVYDMGRRVVPMGAEQFTAICAQHQPYPFPTQHQAWFAVVFWPKLATSKVEPYLWFLRMPLDERGLLSLTAQQDFMTQVITLLGQQISGALTEQQQHQLQQSAYLFTPAEVKRAALHAQLSKRWQRPPSIYYEHAQSELLSPSSEGWQQLGLQGIHDVCQRLESDQYLTTSIAAQWLDYPEPLQKALAEALEHCQAPDYLYQQLIPKLADVSNSQRLQTLRALAGVAHKADAALDKELPLVAALTELLSHASADELVILATRLWPLLQGELLLEFMQRLAVSQSSELFAGIVSDLLRVPSTRTQLLMLLQQPELPAPVAAAWQQFIIKQSRS
ncbi:DUF3549 family protein [Pseudidiomarina sp. PP-1MA]|uniref:DUF3549 family protein n=1 Tax=Pseudidiomarina sp. PP-1MA TaxID=3237706 RepID=A0AB39X3F3_9GAMM